MAFAALSVDLTAKAAQFEETMQRSTKSVDKLRANTDALALGIKTVFGAAAVGGLVNFAKSGLDAADAMAKLSARTGVSVKDLAGYKLAADLADTSIDEVGEAIQRLTKSIGEADHGNKAMLESLDRLGVTARDPKTAFLQLADAVQKSNDPAALAADLAKVLGRSYATLLPLLQGGSQALRDSAAASETFAESMARLAPDAEKFNDDLTKIKNNAAGLAAKFLSEAVPALNEFHDRVATVVDLVNAGGLFNTLQITAGATDFTESMKRVREEIKLTEEAISGKRARGLDSSAFEEKLRGLNAQLQVLIEQRTKLLMAPPKSASSPFSPQNSGLEDFGKEAVKQSEKIQTALRKAFDPSVLDPFFKSFEQRRREINLDFGKKRAEFENPIGDNPKGFDVQAALTKARSALAAGNSEATEIAAERLRSTFDRFAQSPDAAGFEKRFFSEEIRKFETSVVDAQEKIARSAQDALGKSMGALSKDAEQIKVPVDVNSIVEQVKTAVGKVKEELERDPLKIPIIGVPGGIPQSVDLSRSALQYGGRR